LGPEGWPLLTVETDVNGDSKSTNERGPSLASWAWGWACRAGTRVCSALAALVGPVQNNFLCPHRPASRAGSRAGSPISKYVSLVGTDP
jgi:hypothetical protein